MCIRDRTREEAEKIVEYGKYTPLGSRGFCPTRVCEFGYGDAFANGILEYTRKTNEETMLIPQCETCLLYTSKAICPTFKK